MVEVKSTRPKGHKPDERTIARANWDRFDYVNNRGHRTYCERAQRLEQLFLGGGEQWRAADREKMLAEGRYPIEINEIADAVNTILGFQINNRVAIGLTPRRDASTASAEKMQKVLMKKKDELDYAHLESEMFADGLIQQRGYLDLRVRYDENLNGEPTLELLDPMDVIPDPDAKTYDPDGWADVTISRWLTADEIEADYGPEKAKAITDYYGEAIGEEDFGEYHTNGEERNRFGDPNEDTYDTVAPADEVQLRTRIVRYRVVDRQYWRMDRSAVMGYWPTGDVRPMGNASKQQIQQALRAGVIMLRRPHRRIRWTISTATVVLHDDWSPYSHFSVIPFFPVFRRGKTRGLVDNLEGPQELLNSSVSTVNQIVRNTANSGYTVEQNTLTNMTTDDLETEGSRNGVVIEHRQGTAPPKKLEPNQIPTGIRDLVTFGSEKIKGVSGATDAMRGQGGKNQSGVAGQVQQFAAQLSSAKTIDNLGRSRRIFVRLLIEQLQQTLTEPQVMLITETSMTGKQVESELYINQPDPVDGSIFDPTAGEYDYAFTDQPAHVTFQNSQFDQAMRMKEAGISIPDWVPVKHSNLTDKREVMEEMRAPKHDPVAEADAKKKLAEAGLAQNKAVATSVETQYSALTSAALLAGNPALAPAADAILKSGGFIDQDAAPILPTDVPAVPGLAPPTNTNPLTPANPDVGITAGIETGQPPAGAV